jgi:hypothetical protein
MKSLYVILDGHQVREVDGPTWAAWLASAGIEGRRVALADERDTLSLVADRWTCCRTAGS